MRQWLGFLLLLFQFTFHVNALHSYIKASTVCTVEAVYTGYDVPPQHIHKVVWIEKGPVSTHFGPTVYVKFTAGSVCADRVNVLLLGRIRITII